MADKYDKEKISADYIFLSPPWGVIKYKKSDVYSIRELMTPSINNIVKMSLKTAKKIMFYLPRTLILEELFDIIYEITKNDRIFFDIHILKSANKIKALLIIFGEDIDKKVNKEDMLNYFQNEYQTFNISDSYIKVFLALRKILGTFRLFKIEYQIRMNLLKDNFYSFENGTKNLAKEVIKTIFNSILTEQEKIKLKSLNLLPKGSKGNCLKTRETFPIGDSDSTMSSSTSDCSFSLIKIGWELKRIKEISFEIII